MPTVISKDGTVIAYDKTGEGPVLILVLGALNRRNQGKKLATLLSDTFTVVSYDRRGRGDSTNTLPYSTTREVEDIEAIISELGGSAYIYGHSSGCILALLAAKQLGDHIQAMALYELPHNSDPAYKKISKAYRTELSQLLADNDLDGAVSLFIASVGVTEKQITAMKRLPMWKGLTAMAPTLAYDTIELMELYPRIIVNDIPTHTLLLYGGNSPSFMAETAESLADSMPHAESSVLDGQTHDVKAAALAPVLHSFSNRTPW